MSTIYVIQCQSGKYYVGRTDDLGKRIQEHLSGSGSSWTKMYKPVKVIETIQSSDPYDEDKYVKKSMEKYGIENVRGGSYVTRVLNDTEMQSLQKEIWGAKNCCTNCGSKSHFVKDCPVEDEEVCWECEYCGICYKTESACAAHEQVCGKSKTKGVCFRCGRDGHMAYDCFAKTTKDGEDLSDNDDFGEEDDADDDFGEEDDDYY